MDLAIAGKKVVITGASKGIGYACAEVFASEGCLVTIVGSSEVRLAQARDKIRATHNVRVDTVTADLSTEEGQSDVSDILASTDILVNNAGAIPGGDLDAVQSEIWRKSWDLKVFSYINLTRTALSAMLTRGDGVVVNVIGIAGANPRYDYICGSTANAALIAFTKAVGGHSTARGVRVLGINPGPTRTERLESLYKSRALSQLGDEKLWPEMLSNMPFGRAAEASEIADLTVFLSSKRASYLSGMVVDADGGAMYR